LGDIYAIITAICWSSAVILFDISSKKFDAIQLSALKNFIGVLGFIITILVFSIPLPIFTIDDVFILFISGILGILIADLFFLESLRRLGSGLSAVISTIYTPSIFIISFLLYQETVSSHAYFGGLLVISGIAISTFKIPNLVKTNDLYIGIILGIVAQILTAYSVLIVKPIMQDSSIVYIALYRFGIGLLATILVCIIKYGYIPTYNNFKKGLSNYSVVFGSIMGTYLSVIFWLAGYKYTLAGRAAIYNQLSTIFIILMARMFLKEELSIKKMIGVGLSIIGALIVSIVQ
tara:strand:- start:824 stop:1696 length:873 start_codon:yes stop_codon:yes gene_type:complete